MERDIYISAIELKNLITKKLKQAGLSEEQARECANHLVYADEYGISTHGSVRTKYYCNRLKAGGTKTNPKFEYKQTGPTIGIFEADNGIGLVVAKEAMIEAIKLAKENGTGMVGIKNTEHVGTMSYYLRMAAQEGLIALAMCQADPHVLPYGSKEPYFGTNPFGFSAPQKDGEPIIMDMATSIQAFGKISNAKLRNESIPENWGVDIDGNPTADPSKVVSLFPMAGPKGYGLAMMIDILAGSMLGLNFGKNVSLASRGNSKPRNLGMFIMVINPKYFGNDHFTENIKQMIAEIHELTPADNIASVQVPGEGAYQRYLKNKEQGIPVIKKIYEYLISDDD